MNYPKYDYQNRNNEFVEVQEAYSFPRWPGRLCATIGAILALCYLIQFIYSAQSNFDDANTAVSEVVNAFQNSVGSKDNYIPDMQDILNYGSKLATMQALETSKPHLLCVALALTLTIAGIVTYRNWAILISACLMVSAAVLIYSCTAINIAALFVFIAVLFLIAYFLMDI